MSNEPISKTAPEASSNKPLPPVLESSDYKSFAAEEKLLILLLMKSTTQLVSKNSLGSSSSSTFSTDVNDYEIHIIVPEDLLQDQLIASFKRWLGKQKSNTLDYRTRAFNEFEVKKLEAKTTLYLTPFQWSIVVRGLGKTLCLPTVFTPIVDNSIQTPENFAALETEEQEKIGLVQLQSASECATWTSVKFPQDIEKDSRLVEIAIHQFNQHPLLNQQFLNSAEHFRTLVNDGKIISIEEGATGYQDGSRETCIQFIFDASQKLFNQLEAGLGGHRVRNQGLACPCLELPPSLAKVLNFACKNKLSEIPNRNLNQGYRFSGNIQNTFNGRRPDAETANTKGCCTLL